MPLPTIIYYSKITAKRRYIILYNRQKKTLLNRQIAIRRFVRIRYI